LANVELELTVIGNLTTDPELRWTPAGAAVCNFTIAHTPRQFDRNANEWKDGTTTFMRCSVWREQAENVAQSLTKGMGVIAQGRLKSRSYQTKEGEDRTVLELEVAVIGPSLERATAVVHKAGRNGSQQATSGGFAGNAGQSQAGQGWGGQQATQQPAGGDPWANPNTTANAGGWAADDGNVPF
jgi:single-strand DNA-binding protein